MPLFVAVLLFFQASIAHSKPHRKLFKVLPKRSMQTAIGQAIFERIWVASPTRTFAADGLGPLYHARSCIECHRHNGRGTVETNQGTLHVSTLLKIADDQGNPLPKYGKQLQPRAVQGLAGEARIKVSWQKIPFQYPDGQSVVLKKPIFHIKKWGYGQPSRRYVLSARLSPPLIGLGWLEKITDAQIIANAEQQAQINDGVRGVIHYVGNAIGRFNWKASAPTVAFQSALALHHDMGLSNPVFTSGYGDCTAKQQACLNAPHGNTPEMENLEVPSILFKPMVAYLKALVPPKHVVTNKQGQALFHQIGCASCHVPSYQIGNQTIFPYTDLLLHDMGDQLDDGLIDGQASGSQWRTAPLWGIGDAKKVFPKARFLHDGRAETIEEAILWHGGEAEMSQSTFVNLSAKKRQALIQFLSATGGDSNPKHSVKNH